MTGPVEPPGERGRFIVERGSVDCDECLGALTQGWGIPVGDSMFRALYLNDDIRD